MQRLEKFLFYVFVFLIPFQIRTFIFWRGNEWNSVFLYLADILLIIVFLLAIFRKGFCFQKKDLLLGLFLLFGGISLLISVNLEISIFHFIKILEFVLLYVYIRSNFSFLKLNRIFLIIISSGVVQSILAIAQFLNQKSLGLKFIEAGVFNPNMPGVANFIYNGERIMRAYGSFPHANILAGFLILVIFSLYALWLSKERKFLFLIPFLFLFIFVLFLTFSRAAFIVFIFASLCFFLIKFFQLRLLPHTEKRILASKRLILLFLIFAISCLISTAILFPYLKARFFTISLKEQALDLRFFYNKMAFTMIKEKPFLGTGIGTFVWHSQSYPVFLRAASKISNSGESSLVIKGSEDKEIPEWLFQPVHNIYLLIAAEIGILGLLIFLLFILMRIFSIPVKINWLANPLLFSVLCYLVLGLVDHYFWTLQSGGIMFWLTLGLIKKD